MFWSILSIFNFCLVIALIVIDNKKAKEMKAKIAELEKELEIERSKH